MLHSAVWMLVQLAAPWWQVLPVGGEIHIERVVTCGETSC